MGYRTFYDSPLGRLVLEEAEKQAHLETQRAYLELLSPYFVVCKNMNVTEFKDHLARYERYYQEGRSRGVETVLKELNA